MRDEAEHKQRIAIDAWEAKLAQAEKELRKKEAKVLSYEQQTNKNSNQLNNLQAENSELKKKVKEAAKHIKDVEAASTNNAHAHERKLKEIQATVSELQAKLSQANEVATARELLPRRPESCCCPDGGPWVMGSVDGGPVVDGVVTVGWVTPDDSGIVAVG